MVPSGEIERTVYRRFSVSWKPPNDVTILKQTFANPARVGGDESIVIATAMVPAEPACDFACFPRVIFKVHSTWILAS